MLLWNDDPIQYKKQRNISLEPWLVSNVWFLSAYIWIRPSSNSADLVPLTFYTIRFNRLFIMSTCRRTNYQIIYHYVNFCVDLEHVQFITHTHTYPIPINYIPIFICTFPLDLPCPLSFPLFSSNCELCFCSCMRIFTFISLAVNSMHNCSMMYIPFLCDSGALFSFMHSFSSFSSTQLVRVFFSLLSTSAPS